jgi:ABC-type uncharacterized transport system substrate-binding protein
MSYGIDLVDLYRRAATYVDRILRDAKPRELPVQAPSEFEMVINLQTARALGLDVPLHLQQLADGNRDVVAGRRSAAIDGPGFSPRLTARTLADPLA